VITPAGVLRLANRIDKQLDARDDVLEFVKHEVQGIDVPAELVPHVTSLVLLVLHDRADAELARLRARR
jgi:hypothetical protein